MEYEVHQTQQSTEEGNVNHFVESTNIFTSDVDVHNNVMVNINTSSDHHILTTSQADMIDTFGSVNNTTCEPGNVLNVNPTSLSLSSNTTTSSISNAFHQECSHDSIANSVNKVREVSGNNGNAASIQEKNCCEFKKTDGEICGTETNERFCDYHKRVLAAVELYITQKVSTNFTKTSDMVSIIQSNKENHVARKKNDTSRKRSLSDTVVDIPSEGSESETDTSSKEKRTKSTVNNDECPLSEPNKKIKSRFKYLRTFSSSSSPNTNNFERYKGNLPPNVRKLLDKKQNKLSETRLQAVNQTESNTSEQFSESINETLLSSTTLILSTHQSRNNDTADKDVLFPNNISNSSKEDHISVSKPTSISTPKPSLTSFSEQKNSFNEITHIKSCTDHNDVAISVKGVALADQSQSISTRSSTSVNISDSIDFSKACTTDVTFMKFPRVVLTPITTVSLTSTVNSINSYGSEVSPTIVSSQFTLLNTSSSIVVSQFTLPNISSPSVIESDLQSIEKNNTQLSKLDGRPFTENSKGKALNSTIFPENSTNETFNSNIFTENTKSRTQNLSLFTKNTAGNKNDSKNFLSAFIQTLHDLELKEESYVVKLSHSLSCLEKLKSQMNEIHEQVNNYTKALQQVGRERKTLMETLNVNASSHFPDNSKPKNSVKESPHKQLVNVFTPDSQYISPQLDNTTLNNSSFSNITLNNVSDITLDSPNYQDNSQHINKNFSTLNTSNDDTTYNTAREDLSQSVLMKKSSPRKFNLSSNHKQNVNTNGEPPIPQLIGTVSTRGVTCIKIDSEFVFVATDKPSCDVIAFQYKETKSTTYLSQHLSHPVVCMEVVITSSHGKCLFTGSKSGLVKGFKFRADEPCHRSKFMHGEISAMHFAVDNNLYLGFSEGVIRQIDAQKRNDISDLLFPSMVRRLPGVTCITSCKHDDFTMIVYGTRHSVIYMRNTSGELVRSFGKRNTFAVLCMKLIDGYIYAVIGDSIVSYDISKGSDVGRMRMKFNFVVDPLRYFLSNESFVTVDYHLSNIQSFDFLTETNVVIYESGHDEEVSCIHGDGEKITYATKSGKIYVINCSLTPRTLKLEKFFKKRVQIPPADKISCEFCYTVYANIYRKNTHQQRQSCHLCGKCFSYSCFGLGLLLRRHLKEYHSINTSAKKDHY